MAAAVFKVSHIFWLGILVLVVLFELKIFKKILRFVVGLSPSLNNSAKLATSITNIIPIMESVGYSHAPMHSSWENVQRMIQHLNWRHRGEVTARKADVTLRRSISL